MNTEGTNDNESTGLQCQMATGLIISGSAAIGGRAVGLLGFIKSFSHEKR